MGGMSASPRNRLSAVKMRFVAKGQIASLRIAEILAPLPILRAPRPAQFPLDCEASGSWIGGADKRT